MVKYVGALLMLTLGVLGGRTTSAQPTGGRAGLIFLNLPSQARSAALGTYHFTLPGSEAALFLQNPALLDTTKHQSASLSLMPYLADTRLLSTAYARSLKKHAGTWAVGVQYFHYGTFVQTDPAGNVTGEFRAADYALSAGYGHTVGNITLGGTLKWVGSGVENYQLWGLAVDWGAVFHHPHQDLTAGLVVKNAGFLRASYAGSEVPPLPLDVRLGLTFKPTYMPIRFSATAHHLYRFDMVYNDPALFYTFDANGNRLPRKVPLSEKILRHLAVGAEVLIHPQFRLMLGYDHLRRQELRQQNVGGLAGLSFGAWLKISRFEIGYGRAQYVAGLGSSTLSIHADLK